VEVTPLTYALAALAGLLTMLNPCVLPVLPMVAGAAAQRSRAGLIGLGGGLVTAFVGFSLAVIVGGGLLGLESDRWRQIAGTLMVAFGGLLASARAQAAFTRATAGLGESAHGLSQRITGDHPLAQAGLGLLLGIAWTPCVGPTLGAAMGLAASGESVGAAATIMLVFGVFSVIPLLAAGLATRALFLRKRASMASWAARGRLVMGIGLVLVGALVLTGLDKALERVLVDWMPTWLLQLTTSV